MLAHSLTHFFIIPNYKEDPEVLSATVEFLSRHQHAKQNYYILFAM